MGNRMQTREGSFLGVPPLTQAEGLSRFGSERLPRELGPLASLVL